MACTLLGACVESTDPARVATRGQSIYQGQSYTNHPEVVHLDIATSDPALWQVVHGQWHSGSALQVPKQD